jgi:hypothetical protein
VITASDWEDVASSARQLELSVSVLLVKAPDREPLSALVGAVQRLGLALAEARRMLPEQPQEVAL